MGHCKKSNRFKLYFQEKNVTDIGIRVKVGWMVFETLRSITPHFLDSQGCCPASRSPEVMSS